jgi:hypothetical protein
LVCLTFAITSNLDDAALSGAQLVVLRNSVKLAVLSLMITFVDGRRMRESSCSGGTAWRMGSQLA